MSGRRALVTGGAGFIGSHLVDALLEAGWQVRVLDDLSRGNESNLARSRERIEWLRSDIRERAASAEAVADIDVVFHLAAIPSVVESVADPLGTESVNVGGTLGLLEAARGAGVGRFVFAASCAAYGDDERLPKREDMQARPGSPYALQKLACEHYCRLYSELHGLDTVALRYFNVFGPRQDPSGDYAAVVPRFIDAALRGEPLCVFGDGGQTRDFVYVGDVVRANLLAAEAEGVSGALINIASGVRTPIRDLAAIAAECAGRDLELHHEPARGGEVRHSQADIGRARELLAFRPSVDLKEGMRLTVEGFRNRETHAPGSGT